MEDGKFRFLGRCKRVTTPLIHRLRPELTRPTRAGIDREGITRLGTQLLAAIKQRSAQALADLCVGEEAYAHYAGYPPAKPTEPDKSYVRGEPYSSLHSREFGVIEMSALTGPGVDWGRVDDLALVGWRLIGRAGLDYVDGLEFEVKCSGFTRKAFIISGAVVKDGKAWHFLERFREPFSREPWRANGGLEIADAPVEEPPSQKSPRAGSNKPAS